MKLLLFLLITLGQRAYAQDIVPPSYNAHDALMNAMQVRSLNQTNDEDDEPNDVYLESQEADGNNTCLWGGWISTLDDNGRCQAPFRLDVYNDPFIKGFGQTYDPSMRCGSASLYRCNPVIFGTGEGNDSNGYCVRLPRADSALLMSACRSAAQDHAGDHLEKLKRNPELLGQYINQAAEIAVQCRQSANQCGDFINEISRDIRPAVTCHQSADLFPYMLSSSNLAMIDELTGTLGTEYSRYIQQVLDDRNRAIAHNRALLDRSIQSYSQSTEVRRMWARLNQNFRVAYNSRRRRTGTKAPGRSLGRCLMYAKLGLVSGGFFSQYPSELHAKNFGPHLDRAGFTNLMNVPGFEDITPETAPPGAVIIYRGGTSGHIEVKMEDGQYGSDFIKDEPISEYMARYPIGIYVKLTNTDGLLEVPNE